MTMVANDKTRQKAIQTLRERVALLRRRGWSLEERRAMNGQTPSVEEEIRDIERRIGVLKRAGQDGDTGDA